ncbi:unnamed protein product [Pleuronectes platessa]|uniref:Uncharacterized protein n=1 Tax=Pleuronectes platessa TaxID=8262 RepID=A0A9N7VNZ6_PLEPL|nr:unnamed protein product [Pleuronectes platessa]
MSASLVKTGAEPRRQTTPALRSHAGGFVWVISESRSCWVKSSPSFNRLPQNFSQHDSGRVQQEWALRSVASSHTANYPGPRPTTSEPEISPPVPNAPDTHGSNAGPSSPLQKFITIEELLAGSLPGKYKAVWTFRLLSLYCCVVKCGGWRAVLLC